MDCLLCWVNDVFPPLLWSDPFSNDEITLGTTLWAYSEKITVMISRTSGLRNSRGFIDEGGDSIVPDVIKMIPMWRVGGGGYTISISAGVVARSFVRSPTPTPLPTFHLLFYRVILQEVTELVTYVTLGSVISDLRLCNENKQCLQTPLNKYNEDNK